MNKDKHIPQGYKNSPLGIIPKEWEVKRLGDIAKVQGGYAFDSKKMSNSPQKYQIIKMGNLYGGKLDLSRCKSYWKSINKTEKDYLLKEGDIVITLTGTVGKQDYGNSARIKDEKHLLLNQRNAKISSKTIDNNYLFAVVNSERFLHQFYDSSRGGTGSQTNVGIPDLENIRIYVPPLEEQMKISNVGILWDTAIEKQSELTEKLTLRKRALMQQLLTGKKRLTGFKGEWKRIKLGEIAERSTRKNEEDNKNVVTISAQRGFVVQTDFFNKSVASETLDNYFLVHRNEFCYNKSYSTGYPMGAIKRLKTFDKAVVTTLYICFRLIDYSSVNIDFFEQFCESGILNKELLKIANEGGRAHGLLNVTPSDFFNMHMRLPNIDEQDAIANVLVNADKEIELAKEKLTSLQSQKRGLMQQLLTGKKRIL